VILNQEKLFISIKPEDKDDSDEKDDEDDYKHNSHIHPMKQMY